MQSTDKRLTRIGVFYDGNFFLHVSNYYAHIHPRRSRISISGLHDFLRQRAANEEGVDVKYCQIVDAHYFRGRLRAQAAEQRDVLMRERVFDDVLMRQGVTTHYLPLGPEREKGIDVWLALEAYELAIYRKFDILVLVACDGDYVPLVRKLNTLGTRVMLLAWDFRYSDQNGNDRETRTAQALLEEVTYPVLMHQVIDDRSLRNEPVINGLFLPRPEAPAPRAARSQEEKDAPAGNGAGTGPGTGVALTGSIQALKEGFGFITPEAGGNNLFFFHTSLLNADFSELSIGETVTYDIGENDRGPCAVRVRVVDAA